MSVQIGLQKEATDSGERPDCIGERAQQDGDMPYRMWLTITPDYKAGDPEPEGYLNWHAWAEVQEKAGLKSEQCGICSLWQYPQGMSDKTISGEEKHRNGRKRKYTQPVCKKCAEKIGTQ